jgi:hypothetical protein
VARITRRTSGGHASYVTKPRGIKMFTRYEFSCVACGTGYQRSSCEATHCPNPNCRAGYMQLISVLEIAQNAGIFTGYPKRTKIEKILDR